MASNLVTCPKCNKLFAASLGECPSCRAQTFGKGCAGIFIVAIGIIAFRSCSDDAPVLPEPKPAPHSTPQPDAKNDSEDQTEATKRGLSLEEYRERNAQQQLAHFTCLQAIKDGAKYDYKEDLIPKYTWSFNGVEIVIKGHDIRLQNGFGVYGYVSYTCRYSAVAGEIASLTVKP